MSAALRHLETIYCDDIREEKGNKVSFMGIYGPDLFVSAIPTILPKLCIAVSVVTSANNPLESLEVKILKDENANQVELLSTGQVELSDVKREDDSQPKFQVMTLFFALSPFEVDAETKIRVIAETESEVLNGRALRIRLAPDGN